MPGISSPRNVIEVLPLEPPATSKSLFRQWADQKD